MKREFLARFFAKVNVTPYCWIWTGCVDPNGYGRISIKHVNHHAYRAFYLEVVGKVPPGLELDHRCRNRLCVNPAHLEVVTHRTNSLRGNNPCSRNAAKTHCINGHPFNGDNLAIYKRGRHCRACAHIKYMRRRYA